MPGGRPTSFTRPIALKIAELVTQGVPRRNACAMVGVDYSTCKRWMKAGAAGQEPYTEFHALLRKADAEWEAALLIQIDQGVATGGPIWRLQHDPRTRGTWGERSQFDGDDNSALDYSKLSDDDLETVERITRKATGK
jgi:hypothetical protein